MDSPNKMTEQERAYATELLAASLFEGFRTLLNPELAKAVAEVSAEKISMIQAHKGKVL